MFLRSVPAYLLVAWSIAQVVSVVDEPLALPDWFDTTVLILLAIGFPGCNAVCLGLRTHAGWP